MSRFFIAIYLGFAQIKGKWKRSSRGGMEEQMRDMRTRADDSPSLSLSPPLELVLPSAPTGAHFARLAVALREHTLSVEQQRSERVLTEQGTWLLWQIIRLRARAYLGSRPTIYSKHA